MEVATIIISSLTLGVSCITPIITASAFFISHIKKSSCCGSYVELETDRDKKKPHDLESSPIVNKYF